jgi:hypothetical protein
MVCLAEVVEEEKQKNADVKEKQKDANVREKQKNADVKEKQKGEEDKYIINILLLYMTDVIIHIFPGIGREPRGTFDEMRTQGLVEFKNYLLTVLGHVGISFPPDETVYGYGPNITQEDLDNLRKFYQIRTRSDRSKEKVKWTALNFLFREKSRVFAGEISDDTDFFNEHEHIKIPLRLVDKTAEQALAILNDIKAPYGNPHSDDTKENCLTAIFNHLPLTYPDGKPVVLREVYMLRVTLEDLQTKYQGKKEESGAAGPVRLAASGAAGAAAASKQGGRRRRKKTKKKTKKKRKTRKKRKFKKKGICCVGSGCPEWLHCINVLGDPSEGIRPKSKTTLKIIKRCAQRYSTYKNINYKKCLKRERKKLKRKRKTRRKR